MTQVGGFQAGAPGIKRSRKGRRSRYHGQASAYPSPSSNLPDPNERKAVAGQEWPLPGAKGRKWARALKSVE